MLISLREIIASLSIVGLCALSLQAAPPRLVKDFNPQTTAATSVGIDTKNLRVAGDCIYFSSDTPFHGQELWKSDGTNEGTYRIKDICVGGGDSNPSNLVAIGNILYFTATHLSYGTELWRSDGTSEGTILVKDIAVGITSSSPTGITVVGSHMYFAADDGVNGVELWKSDGTADGTVMVKDIASGGVDSSPTSLKVFGNEIYFAANDGVNGNELWKSDGTEFGTVLVRDINLGAGNSDPSSMCSTGQILFFAAHDGVNGNELWKSDGTESGTILVKNISPTGNSSPTALTVFQDILYFAANDGVKGVELWRSDGSEVGTLLFKEIALSSGSSSPREFTEMDGLLYFATTSGLWRTDGTVTGTSLVRSFENTSKLTRKESELYFTAENSSSPTSVGMELWKLDGTSGSVVLVKDINTRPVTSEDGGGGGRRGTASSNPSYLTIFNEQIYFVARLGLGVTSACLFKSNGTAEATIPIVEAKNFGENSSYADFDEVDEMFYFNVQNSVWKTDGTEERTASVQFAGSVRYFDLLKKFYYCVRTSTDVELWKSDGTAMGTTKVCDGFTLSDFDPSYLTQSPYGLYFVANNGQSGKELWFSGGTAETTYMVKDIAEGTATSNPVLLTVSGSTLFFRAKTMNEGGELWKSDGTLEGTVMVKDILPGSGGSNPYDFTATDGGVYFWANGKLWWSDGTEDGTMEVEDIPPSQPTSHNIVVFQNELYQVCYDNIYGAELWKGETILKDLYSGPNGSLPSCVTVMGEMLYFFADDGVHGQELWRSDGTEAGTVMVKDVLPGRSGAVVDSFEICASENLVFFSANDGVHGNEIWQSDGTSEGTVLVGDITGESGDSDPVGLFVAGGKLYFLATTEEYGQELYIYDPGDTDGDYISDAWENYHGLDLNNPVDAMEDWDGDGQGNLAEYYAGTHPLLPGSRFETTISNPLSGEYGIHFTALEGKKYSVLYSDDLSDPVWQVLHQFNDPVTDDSEITILDTPPPGTVGRFYKVVTPPVP